MHTKNECLWERLLPSDKLPENRKRLPFRKAA